MQYLWLMSREPTLSDDLLDQMMATAKAALPNYDFTQLTKDVQKESKCKYVNK